MPEDAFLATKKIEILDKIMGRSVYSPDCLKKILFWFISSCEKVVTGLLGALIRARYPLLGSLHSKIRSSGAESASVTSAIESED